ncbi:MAG: DUF4783 domain-containing protein [Saprospiraceae bacterium]|nr:DUF4783 domain-containing protein [Saprospiraceae bacterium]
MNIQALLFCITMVAPWGLGAQSSAIQEVGQALRKGNAAAVATHFDQSVVIELMGVEKMAPKAEAQRLLEDFFKSHPPTAFRQSHAGDSQGKDSHYVIGDLSDAGGKYRVYLYFRTTGGRYLLQELRIDR